MYILKPILISYTLIIIFAIDIKCNNINNMIFHIYSGNGRNCSATLISENFLLTRLSCLVEPIMAFDGSYKYGVDYVRKHPNFTGKGKVLSVFGKF